MYLHPIFAILAFAFPLFGGPAKAQSRATTTEWQCHSPSFHRLLARAQKGHASAQFWMGTALEQGWCGKIDLLRPLRWYRRSAAQGDPDAQNALGQMYEDGSGVTEDYTVAAKWYLRAAEHVPDLGGAGQGRNNLGLLYMEGLGVPKDLVQAYMWFRLAGPNLSLSHIRSKMTEPQILQAEQLAENWRRVHPAK